jgi:hypothetical protein
LGFFVGFSLYHAINHVQYCILSISAFITVLAGVLEKLDKVEEERSLAAVVSDIGVRSLPLNLR